MRSPLSLALLVLALIAPVSSELVTVFGAAGNEVVPLLARHASLSLRLVYHNSKPDLCSEDAPKTAATVECIKGDLTDVKSVHEALSGAERAIFMVPTGIGLPPMARNFVAAAQHSTTLRQTVFVSECEPDSFTMKHMQIYRESREVLDILKHSHLPIVRLEPGVFMDDMHLFFGLTQTLQGGPEAEMVLGLDPEAKLAWVDLQDIARAVEKVVLAQPPHYNNEHFQLVSDRRTLGEMLTAIGTAAGHRIHYRQASLEQMRATYTQAGFPAWLINDLPLLHKHAPQFLASIDTQELAGLIGQAPTTLEAYANRMGPLYRQWAAEGKAAGGDAGRDEL